MLSKFQGLVWGKLLVEVFRVRGGVVHGEADTDVLVRVLILRCPHIYRLAWWPVIRQVVRYTASGPLYGKWSAILHAPASCVSHRVTADGLGSVGMRFRLQSDTCGLGMDHILLIIRGAADE